MFVCGWMPANNHIVSEFAWIGTISSRIFRSRAGDEPLNGWIDECWLVDGWKGVQENAIAYDFFLRANGDICKC